MTTFKKQCMRPVALSRLNKAGWVRRAKQNVESDFEAFVRSSGEGGLLLIDFAFGRFILDVAGNQAILLTHNDNADGDPEYDAILHSLFEGEVVG